MYRLIICVDVETNSLADAYKQVYEGMTKSGLDWESSDEWYDKDGETGDPDVLQEARMEVPYELFGRRISEGGNDQSHDD
jgi:hypothetical protein